MKLRVWCARALIVAVCAWSGLVMAQDDGGLVEVTTKARSPIYGDDINRARATAIELAQRKALLELLDDLTYAQWIESFKVEIEELISHPERYIRSYNIGLFQTSADRTNFDVQITSQIDSRALSEALAKIGVPLKLGIKLPVGIIYGDGTPPQYNQVALLTLSQHLEMLNFEPLKLLKVDQSIIELFANTNLNVAQRGQWIERQQVVAVIFIEVVAETLNLLVYQGVTGTLEAKFAINLDADGYVAALQKLTEQLQPPSLRRIEDLSSRQASVRIRIAGLGSIGDIEQFVSQLFSTFRGIKNVELVGADGRSSTYQIIYHKNAASISEAIKNLDLRDFSINDSFVFGDLVEIDASRKKKTLSQPLKLVSDFNEPINASIADEPSQELNKVPIYFAEQEENGWFEEANQLNFNAGIIATLDSRSDRDFFVAEELLPETIVRISWDAMGKSNLYPSLRVYNQHWEPQRKYYMRNKIIFDYEIPQGQDGFYILVADRYGTLDWDSGGYLKAEYLLKVDIISEPIEYPEAYEAHSANTLQN